MICENWQKCATLKDFEVSSWIGNARGEGTLLHAESQTYTFEHDAKFFINNNCRRVASYVETMTLSTYIGQPTFNPHEAWYSYMKKGGHVLNAILFRGENPGCFFQIFL